MNENGTCAIWNTPITSPIYNENYKQYVDSPRAGGKYCFDVVGRAAMKISKLDDRAKARLTTWLIEQRELGKECPEVTSGKIESIVQRSALSVHARADRLLKYIQKKSPNIGKEFVYWKGINLPTMEMLADTESTNEEEELRYLLNYLIEQGWLTPPNGAGGVEAIHVTITFVGYAHLAKLEKVKVDSSKAFVAMWFNKSLDPAFEDAIEPAIKDAGYTAVRIDNTDFLGNIPDKIIAEIRRSRFIVADFTQGDKGNCGGVYYEAGFARGLGIPVISTCSKDTIDKVHFDVRQQNHILWENPEELRGKLTDRITAVIGDGPLKK